MIHVETGNNNFMESTTNWSQKKKNATKKKYKQIQHNQPTSDKYLNDWNQIVIHSFKKGNSNQINVFFVKIAKLLLLFFKEV